MNFIEIAYKPSVSGLTKLITDLITSFSSVAVGIIVFTLLLKLVTLVFDYYSRSSMRKSSLKMKQMRPELERLQEQYKDNKELYSQKVMSLYKKEGYSVFGSCLPTIITLVIFIIVLNAFSAYSTFQQEENLYNMAVSYNQVLIDGVVVDNDCIKVVKSDKSQNFELSLDAEKIYNAYETEGFITVNEGTANQSVLNITKNGNAYTVTSETGYIDLKFSITVDGDTYTLTKDDSLFSVNVENLKNSDLKVNGKTYTESYAEYNTTTATEFVKAVQSKASADTFFNELQSFLWVKNIWKTDAVYAFSGCANIVKISPMIDNNKVLKNENDYNLITEDLKDFANEPNGYYILILLTIGSMLLSQFISMRGQKDQLELQTVDGQGAQTQKTMMWMMPLMMAFFAFIYSAAFSIYIIISTLIGTITTIVINKIVDVQFAKKEGTNETNIVRRG